MFCCAKNDDNAPTTLLAAKQNEKNDKISLIMDPISVDKTEYEEAVEQIFEKLDVDGSEIFSKEEWKALFPNMNPTAFMTMMSVLDKDRDGKVSKDEIKGKYTDLESVQELLSKMETNEYEAHVDNVFSRLDVDGSENFSKDEWKTLFPDMSPTAFTSLFSVLDKDRDGNIDREEITTKYSTLEEITDLLQKMDENEYNAAIDSVFAKLDVDDSENFSTKEWKALFPNMSPCAFMIMMSVLDQDRDGKVTRDELITHYPTLDEINKLIKKMGDVAEKTDARGKTQKNEVAYNLCLHK